METSSVNRAREFLQKAADRHGGFAAFRDIEAITIRLDEMRGSIPVAKGIGRTFSLPDQIVVYPNLEQASFAYPDGAIQFDRGAIVYPSRRISNYRTSFNGVRKLRFWTNYDAVYFFGYSLVNYFSLPFILEAIEIRNANISALGPSWIEVMFPVNADTHSQHQRFWFDDTGLLFRHDYRADILGPIFYGAHFSQDYRFDFPIPIAQNRVVKIRLGHVVTPFAVLNGRFHVEAVT